MRIPTPSLAPAAAWRRFEDRLACTLSVLEPAEFLILSPPALSPYVQFAIRGPVGDSRWVTAEATSGCFLGIESLAPDPERHLRLLELGWAAPSGFDDGGAATDESTFSPNYSVEMRAPDDLPALARLATTTLHEVFGVASPADLLYDAFKGAGGTIRLPELGLPLLPVTVQ